MQSQKYRSSLADPSDSRIDDAWVEWLSIAVVSLKIGIELSSRNHWKTSRNSTRDHIKYLQSDKTKECRTRGDTTSAALERSKFIPQVRTDCYDNHILSLNENKQRGGNSLARSRENLIRHEEKTRVIRISGIWVHKAIRTDKFRIIIRYIWNFG